MKLGQLQWMVDPKLLPVRLVIYRIVEAASGPIHELEIMEVLKSLGIEATDKSVQQRLSELVGGFPPEFQVKRIHPGIFVSVRYV